MALVSPCTDVCKFDRKVGVLGQFAQFDDGAGNALAIEPRLRFCTITRGDGSEPKAGNAVGKPACHDPADGTQSCNCHGRLRHCE